MELNRIPVRKATEIMTQAQKKRGVTQKGLAEMLGIKQNALCQGIHRNRMSLITFSRVLSALGYDIVIVDRDNGEEMWNLQIADRDDVEEDI